MSKVRRKASPETSPRPRARPADLNTQSAGPQTPEGYGEQGTTPGMYAGLGIEDRTDDFGDLGARKRRNDPNEVILHQTMSTSGESTEDAYAQRVQRGEHVGAHYLIDEEGQTSLTVPTDEIVYHAVGHNSNAIGIENVGMPAQVSQRSDMHAQIEALNLSPQLKARLLAMDEPTLKRTLADNGNYIYQDITGPQKRANWNLLRAIAAEHGISLDDGVDSHEHVQAKTVGEGENIEEMVDAMVAWPGKLDQLEQRIADVRAESSPDRALLRRMSAELASQRAAYAAVEVDKTIQENNALEGEGVLGAGGPATDREALRVTFWNEFFPRMQRLDALLAE